MLTINHEAELFKNFAFKHKGINSFYFGDVAEADTSLKIVYPFMNVLLNGTNLENGTVKRTYLVEICDQVTSDKSNLTSVLSDCERICYDLPHYIKSIRNQGLLSPFNFENNITLTDFTDSHDDGTAGFNFQINIWSAMGSAVGNETYNLPIEDGQVLDSNYIYVGGLAQSNNGGGSFIVEIKDQDGNVIQTFNTSGEYVITVLTKIQQVIGNTTTTIIQNII